MNILAIDTACAACSVAVLRDGAIVARRFQPMLRGHAEALVPMVVATLADCAASFAEVGRIAVTVGPGSFTGIRTGIATASGLALARGLPLTPVTTLEAVAWAAHDPGAQGGRCILVVLETRRAEFYCQLFGADLSPLTEPAAMPAEAVIEIADGKKICVAGDGAAALQPQFGPAGDRVTYGPGPGLPDAAAVAFVAAVRTPPPPGAPTPQPLYLHPPLATVPVAGGRMRP